MKWVIACGPCGEDFVVEEYSDEKPQYCPKCGDCDTVVWMEEQK